MIPRRLAALRGVMKNLRLSSLLITEISHIRYLTGFTGSNGLCCIAPTEQFFLTDRRYKDQAPLEVKHFTIIIAKESLFQTLAEKKIIPHRINVGFESQYVSVADLKNLRKLLHNRRLVPTTSLIEDLASVKDASEIGLIRTAVRITDDVFKKIVPYIHPGVRECDIAAEISYWHRKYGAESDAFDPIVASGARGALPHARASSNIIKYGEMVVLDLGCRYNGYHSDLTRTVAVGKPSRESKKIYQIVLDAQKKAIASARKGQPARRIDNVARTHIQTCGYGRYFTHSLGHGVGIHIHEPLRLSRRSTTVLQTGNVVTVEPGIYIPGIGGVRIEDIIVIHNNDCEGTTTSPKQLMII